MAKASSNRRPAARARRGGRPAARRGTSKRSTQTSLGSAIEAVQDFIERAGKTLSDESRAMLEHAKSILQGHHETSGRKGSGRRGRKSSGGMARKTSRRSGSAAGTTGMGSKKRTARKTTRRSGTSRKRM